MRIRITRSAIVGQRSKPASSPAYRWPAQSSVRSDVFIERDFEKGPSSVEAACGTGAKPRGHAAPTELGISGGRSGFYKHAAPNGTAFELRCRRREEAATGG